MADNPSGVSVPGAISLPAPYPPPAGAYNVKWWGAKGDGSTNDQPAIQSAVNYLLALGNGTLYFPKGTYKLSSTVTITNAKGLGLCGDGPDHSILSAGAFPAVTTVGYWRSLVQGLEFSCSANLTGGAFQLDGQTDGSFGVQGVHFDNCIFNGNSNSKYCLTLCLVAGANGQGSENLWTDCTWIGSSSGIVGSANFYVAGANALQNTVVGGDYQNFVNGCYIAAGNVNHYSTGFQSTLGYAQLAQGGADLSAHFFAGDVPISDGCRSESLQHISGTLNFIVRGFVHQQAAAGAWPGAGQIISTDQYLVHGQTAAGNVKLYRATTPGTTGGSEPTWPESGTVVDNTVTWSFVEFDVIGSDAGLAGFGGHDVSSAQLQLGACQRTQAGSYYDVLFSRYDVYNISNDTPPLFDRCFTGGAPPPGNTGTPVKITTQSSTWVSPASLGNGPAPQLDLASGVLLFRGAAAGGANLPYFDVGVGRKNGDYYSHPKANNTVGPYGGWQLQSYDFATISAASPPDGTQYYCSDGTSKTDGGTPGDALAGSGTGCYAGRQAGIWVSLS